MYINLKATTFTAAQLIEVAKKRYRDVFHEIDVNDTLADAVKFSKTLEEAANALVDLYVLTDGHEQNMILTHEELQERKHKTDKIGLVKAIILAMRKDAGATELELKTTVRYQISMRKLKVDPLGIGSEIVSALVEQELAYTAQGATGTVWKLVKKPRSRPGNFLADVLTDEQLIALSPELLVAPREFPRRHVPRLETAEEF